MDPEPIASPWFVFPIAGVALLAVAAHIIALCEAPKGRIPESRRRIRIATSWVIMFTIPLTAYGFGVANTADPQVFVLVWTAVVGLLGGILCLGLVDMINTLRLHRRDRELLDDDLRRLHAIQPAERDDG